MPELTPEERRSLRNQKDRDRRKARGLKARGNGGPNKNQGRKPSPSRPPCIIGRAEGCRLASHGSRGWYCRKDRGGCGESVKKTVTEDQNVSKYAHIKWVCHQDDSGWTTSLSGVSVGIHKDPWNGRLILKAQSMEKTLFYNYNLTIGSDSEMAVEAAKEEALDLVRMKLREWAESLLRERGRVQLALDRLGNVNQSENQPSEIQ
jgi:hypothetical protein